MQQPNDASQSLTEGDFPGGPCSTAGSMGSIPGRGTKILNVPHATRDSWKIKEYPQSLTKAKLTRSLFSNLHNIACKMHWGHLASLSSYFPLQTLNTFNQQNQKHHLSLVCEWINNRDLPYSIGN